jgi:hypothetical protein
MKIMRDIAAVKAAKARMAVARVETTEPAASLIARGYENPLTVMGMAAGAGFLLSQTKINPMGVPGVSSLLAGGVAEVVGKVAMMAAGSFMDGSGDETA